MTYHIYKTDCYKASRVLMQSTWEDESIFYHRPKDGFKNDDQYLNLKKIFGLAIGIKKNCAVVFHSQSSLPYLILFFFLVKILNLKNFSIVYDIHDLHEKITESFLVRITNCSDVRYYCFRFFEAIIFMIKPIVKITVSKGLAQEMASKYSTLAPIVIRNISLVNNNKNILSSDRYEKAVLFFGTTERVPLEIVAELHAIGMELHLFGRGITENWLRSRIPEVHLQTVKIFGEYSPEKMEFLNNYNFLVIYTPNNLSLNFKYSLPNKLFQALNSGVSVLVSKNFEEMAELFEEIPGSVGVIEDNNLSSSITELFNYRDKKYFYDIADRINFLALDSKELYQSVINNHI